MKVHRTLLVDVCVVCCAISEHDLNREWCWKCRFPPSENVALELIFKQTPIRRPKKTKGTSIPNSFWILHRDQITYQWLRRGCRARRGRDARRESRLGSSTMASPSGRTPHTSCPPSLTRDAAPAQNRRKTEASIGRKIHSLKNFREGWKLSRIYARTGSELAAGH